VALTRRQEIEARMRVGDVTPESLARELRTSLKLIVEDMEHVRCSVRAPERVVVTPARCEDCGFVFRDRSRVSTPSRCPRCRSEAIASARFRIE
jgi:transcriptional regulator